MTGVKESEPMEKAADAVEAVSERADGAPKPLVNLAALVRGVDVELRNAGIGVVVAGDDVKLERGGARSIFAGGNLAISQGGAGMIVAGGDTSIRQGGAQAILSAGGVTMEQAGSGFAIGSRIRVGPKGLVIFAVTPKLEVQEGGKVILGRSAAFAMLGGFAALGALVAFLLRRR